MNRTSKSPNAVARVAYVSALRTFKLFSHRKSPQKFTQPQLVSIRALKEFFRTDYRGIQAILEDSSDLQEILELKQVPDFTTLHKASKRFGDTQSIEKLLHTTLSIATDLKVMKKTVSLAAIDSTGLESHYTSSYFVRRKARGTKTFEDTRYRRYAQVGIAMDVASFLVLAGVPSWGPSPDILHFKKVLTKAAHQKKVACIVADKGYDAEHAHVLAREEFSIRTLIPVRACKYVPQGKYRKLMTLHFDDILYGQRWMIETLNAMLKKRFDSFLRARTYWSQMREIMLRLFVFNVLVLRR